MAKSLGWKEVSKLFVAGAPSTASQSVSTGMAARSRAGMLGNRSRATGTRLIGPYSKGRYHDAKRAGLAYWKGSYVGRISIGYASAQVEGRRHVRTMQMLILDAIPARRQTTTLTDRTWAGRSGAVWVTHATLSFPITSLHNGNEMVAATPELATSGYALEADGRLKAGFATRTAPGSGAEELKKRFPTLQIRIYDAQTNAREEI